MRFCTGGCKDAQEGRKNSAEHTNSTLRFWMQCATISRKLNIKQQVPFIVCRAAEPSGALERVKGKRVQIPHDLVTVIREPAARVLLAPATEALLWEGGGGRRSFSQETCLLLVQEHSRPRGLGRAAGSFQNFSQGCSGHCSWYVPGIPKSIVSVRMVLHHTILEEDIS